MTCVLVTGATGVVGSALVPWYLQEETAQVKILVRADSPSHLEQRLAGLFAFWQPLGLDARGLDRVQALRGDVTSPRWGLSPEDYARLTAELTHVVHAAGNVKLNQPLEKARRSAVDSARQALDLVRACQDHGQFQKLEVISTVGVAGRTGGLIREVPCQAEHFHNTYEQAKADAERLVLAEMAQGLPVTIHRPSMVVGDSRTGHIVHFQVFYYLTEFLSGLRTWGFVPQTGRAKLDIIPADYVARAIHLASHCPETAGRILHLCSGPERSWELSRLTEWLREMLSRRGARLPRLRRLSPAWYRRALTSIRPLVPGKARRFLASLPYFLDYLAEEQLFDNSETDQFLSAAGCAAPAPEQYLETVMERYWNRNA